MKKRLYDIVQFCESAMFFPELTSKAGFAIAIAEQKGRPFVDVCMKKRDALIKKHSEDENSISPQSPHWADFLKEYQELCNTEVELDIELLPADTPSKDFFCETARKKDYPIVMDFLTKKGTDHETEQD